MRKKVIFLFAILLVVSIGVVNAQEDSDKRCGDFRYSTCPDKCERSCVSSSGDGEFSTADCEGIGSCYEKIDNDFDDDFRNENLDLCVDDCKRDYDKEDDRSKCIEGCKLDYGFDDDFDDKGKEGLFCVSCGNECVTVEFASAAMCPPPTNGEPICGERNGECVVFGFDDFGYEDEEIISPGITPDSVFYFLDELFEGVSLEGKEEKVAEIKAMVEEGKYDEAHEALENYVRYAEELEKEITPENIEEAKRSASAIQSALREIEDRLPEDEREEFLDILHREKNIVTAAEIASKIAELCKDLSEIDPIEYGRVCSAGDDAPKWQKELDDDLTAEQRVEAKKFGNIMEQCFKTSGQDCACSEIPYSDFANACSMAAPLAVACDINGDEDACDKLDNLEMPELPEHLQDVFDDMEDAQEARYDIHMPSECVAAGATTPKECTKVMIETGAPDACKQALLDSGCDSEHECREICDEIMMKEHAPQCAEEGITDGDECARFMDSFRGDRVGEGGPKMDFNCAGVEDPTERLACYDGAASQAKSYKGFEDGEHAGNCMTKDDWDAKKNECKSLYGEHAGDEPIMGDSGNGYECVVAATCVDFGGGQGSDDWMIGCENLDCGSNGWCEYGECHEFEGRVGEGERGEGDEDFEGGSCDDCASQCEDRDGQRLAGTGCGESGCECYYESDEPQYGPDEGPGEPEDFEGEPPKDDDDSGSDDDDDSDDDGGITGEAIFDFGEEGKSITGNAFLDYFFGNWRS